VTDSAGAVSIEQLFQAADQALYRSKQDGRNRVTVAGGLFEEETPDHAPTDLVAKANGQRASEPHPNGDSDIGTVNGNGSANRKPRAVRRRTKTPALHEAADEPEPRPTGREIR
jgi:hypothetical protein